MSAAAAAAVVVVVYTNMRTLDECYTCRGNLPCRIVRTGGDGGVLAFLVTGSLDDNVALGLRGGGVGLSWAFLVF